MPWPRLPLATLIHCNSPSQPNRPVRCPATKPTNSVPSRATKAARAGSACCGECSPLKYKPIRPVQKLSVSHSCARITATRGMSESLTGLSVVGVAGPPKFKEYLTIILAQPRGSASQGRTLRLLSVGAGYGSGAESTPGWRTHRPPRVTDRRALRVAHVPNRCARRDRGPPPRADGARRTPAWRTRPRCRAQGHS